MQSKALSYQHLKLYRRVGVSTGILVAVSSVLAVLPGAGVGGPIGPLLAGGTLISGAAALLTQRLGYAAFKSGILRADDDHRRMIENANRDALTGALTRSCFIETIKLKVAESAVAPLAYVQLDMDHLKQLNDGSGHVAGDAALTQLVSKIRRFLPDATIGRLGGDEFGLLLPGCTSHAMARRICQQLLKALEAPITIAARQVRLSATMGVALSPADGTSADELISKADLALYQGKSLGRNMVVSFEKDMLTDERHRRYIERELRGAILMNELDPYYQPIYANDGRTLLYHECLVRWQHPVRGVIPPGEFIHIAEGSYLIDKLGDWVLRRACRDIAALQTPAVAVNVSVAQLQRIDFAERFAAILDETGTDGARLIVEVTESVRLESGGTEKSNLEALKALGVRIAIDDFGAGNASLAYLKAYAFDVLKVDRSYVDAIAHSGVDRMVVESICRIARAAGMTVVVEGIETDEQLATLQALGFCNLQGFLLGRPQPLDLILRQRAAARASAA